MSAESNERNIPEVQFKERSQKVVTSLTHVSLNFL